LDYERIPNDRKPLRTAETVPRVTLRDHKWMIGELDAVQLGIIAMGNRRVREYTSEKPKMLIMQNYMLLRG
jgi:hypothetical protein